MSANRTCPAGALAAERSRIVANLNTGKVPVTTRKIELAESDSLHAQLLTIFDVTQAGEEVDPAPEFGDIKLISGDSAVVKYKDGSGDKTSFTLDSSDSHVQLEPGVTTLYITSVTVNGKEVNVDFQVKVTVKPDAPSASVSSVGEQTVVSVTRAKPNATLKLFDSNGSLVDIITADENGEGQFINVEIGTGYTVTQTVNEVESDPSAPVDVTESDPVDPSEE